VYAAIGSLDLEAAIDADPVFTNAGNCAFHLDLGETDIEAAHVDYFQKLVREAPQKTFSFAFMFLNVPSSPYFPSAKFEKEGFSLGMQSTDLSAGCSSLDEWFDKQRQVWAELNDLFSEYRDFLGIDSSVAPMFEGDSSLVSFLTRLKGGWNDVVVSDSFLRITKFIKDENPKPVGLCGLMLPCLEDFELAAKYQEGQFTVERNIFMSLHSGLGIDTYPIAANEKPAAILDVLKLLQGLSRKYSKCMSARFISDGKARVGERTNFNNEYLKDVTIRPLVN